MVHLNSDWDGFRYIMSKEVVYAFVKQFLKWKSEDSVSSIIADSSLSTTSRERPVPPFGFLVIRFISDRASFQICCAQGSSYMPVKQFKKRWSGGAFRYAGASAFVLKDEKTKKKKRENKKIKRKRKKF